MKLSRAVGILHRLKFIFPHKILLILYFSLFHSYLLYGISIWASNYKSEWKQVQILQNKAIRAICKLEPRQSVKAFLIRLKILNVARLREKKIAETLYKVSTNTAPESFMSVFRRNDEIHQHDTRHASQLVTETRRLTSSGFSIKFTGPKIWNYLPNTLRNANSLPEFKSKIKSFLLENIELDPNFFYR